MRPLIDLPPTTNFSSLGWNLAITLFQSREGFHIARIDLDQVLDLDDLFDVHLLCPVLHVSVRLAFTSYQIIADPSGSGIKE